MVFRNIADISTFLLKNYEETREEWSDKMSRVARAAFYLMIVTIISKILGMGRELVLSSIYGTGLYTESYLTAMNIPNIIFAAIGTAIVTTFIPMYQDINSKKEKKRH